MSVKPSRTYLFSITTIGFTLGELLRSEDIRRELPVESQRGKEKIDRNVRFSPT